MSHHNDQAAEHAAGGLAGLNLGAPVGGVSTTPAHGLTTGSSHTTGLTTGSGLTSGSGLASDHHDRDHGRLDTDAKNSTSGERGIGGGHGGPTAFESNPERVGTDRKHDGPRDHSLGGLTGSSVAEVQARGPAVVAAGDHDFHGKEVRGNTFGEVDNTSKHGHHDRDHEHHDRHESSSRTGSNVPVVGAHDNHGSRTGANVPVVPVVPVGTTGSHHDHSHSHGTGLAAGGLAAGAGAGALGAGALAGGAKPSPYEGVVGDSVTGQQHFKGNSTGLATGAPAAVGVVPVVAAVPAAAATGISPGTLSHDNEKSHHKETGLVAELKQELKDHQKSGGYSDADKHPESEGPHGLVWHNGKYVHKRELDNHGSTGVPLK